MNISQLLPSPDVLISEIDPSDGLPDERLHVMTPEMGLANGFFTQEAPHD